MRGRYIWVVIGLAAMATVSSADTLVRVARQYGDDLTRLRGHEIGVVAEFQAALLVEGDRAGLARLSSLGYSVAELDPDSQRWDYLLAPIDPDEPSGSLATYGVVVLIEENVAVLRVAKNAPLPAALKPGCFGVTRLRRTPLARPTYQPEAKQRAADGSTPDPLVQQIVARVDNAQIQTVWQEITSNPPYGTRYSTALGCEAASQYCFDRYTALGYSPQFDDWSPSHAPNVVAEIPGTTHPERIYILVGHLDDLPSSGVAPGADDNGSGTVTVLEGARAMNCASYRNTVRFLNVTGEEQGLFGSEAYAAAARQRGDDIRGVLNFDMNGWQGDGTPSPENIDISYNSFSQWLGELYAQNSITYGTGLVVDAFSCPSLTASDHASFWNQGYPAIIGITDNHNYCGHAGTYPDYHQSTDTIAANGNPALFYASIRTAVATLAELAEPFVVTFQRAKYSCDATVEVLVSDPGRNLNPGAIETMALTVTSTREPAGETITLTERGTNSKLFSGTIVLAAAAAMPGDERLSVAEGDTLSAVYVDPLDCAGNVNAGYAATATVDCSGPLISAVGETSVTGTQATIVWNTNERADSNIVWGPIVPPSTPATGAADVTSHSVALTGLSECTVYRYEVRSQDEAGNLAIANNGGQYFSFETLGDFGSGLQPCHAGNVAIGQPTWSCTDTATFSVVDLDLNSSPVAVDTAVLEVVSTSEATVERVTVTETGPNTSRFEGSIQTVTGAPQHDGKLQTVHGDLITVTYRDADDGAGRPTLDFATAAIDCAGPQISSLRVESITDARATIRFTTSEPSTATLEWGPTAALGQTVSATTPTTDHALVIRRLDSCAPAHLRVRASDSYGHQSVADDLGAPYRLQAGRIPGLYWKDDFEAAPTTWTLQGEWQVGAPQSRGGSSGRPDPATAYNKDRALGHDLTGLGSFAGDYEPNKTEQATSPSLVATSWQNTKLLIHKRLNVGASDDASIWLQNPQGFPLYRSSGTTVQDTDYAVMSFDVRTLADGKANVRLLIRQQSDANGNFSGWNIDDVIFKNGALADYAACGGCAAVPSFTGAASAQDANGCAGDGVQLSWPRAVAWGTGENGSYAIYRSPTAPFTPSPSTLIASGISATSHLDASAPDDQPLHYIVRAENSETCSTGPANGGLTDDNTLSLTATDWTSRPVPAGVQNVTVELLGGAHVRLNWNAASGSASYRVHRSVSPQPGSFNQLAQPAGQRYDDLGAGADQQTYFYLVRGANECGTEGP